MKKRRNRKKQDTSLEHRLRMLSDQWQREAEESGDSELRSHCEQRARSAEAALGIIAWLGSREARR